MNVEEAIRIYWDEIWEPHAAGLMVARLSCLRENLERRGFEVSDWDSERDPEGSVTISVYPAGRRTDDGPHVVVTLILADSFEDQAHTLFDLAA